MNIMEIDDCVYLVCREWYDGETLPLMTALAFRHTGSPSLDISIPKLLSEIIVCGRENTIVAEAGKIRAAEEWLSVQMARKAALSRIAKAVARAKAAGLERSDIEAEVSRALKVTS